MADTPISPASGSITAAGLAAAMAMSLVIAPGVGAWSVGTAAVTLNQRTVTAIAPAAGGITLAGVAPTFSKPTVTGMTPTVASLAMAGVASTVSQQDGATLSVEGFGQATATWNLVNGQAGAPLPPMPYRTCFGQVTGTFGTGGSVQLEGSNDGQNWVKLSAAALTSAGFFAALGTNERPKFIRPNCTAGDATTALVVTGWFAP